ncbi:MAG TPA: hypothetical protein VGM18_15095 [Candidatus Sulfotelmatobacter sp.]|jgi:hypothetical protein
MAADRHPGISMHRLTVGGGLMGLVFAIGCALIFVIGFPALWSFVAFSAAFGIVIAIVLHLASGHQSKRNQPLSILSTDEKGEMSAARPREKRASQFRSTAVMCAPSIFLRRASASH